MNKMSSETDHADGGSILGLDRELLVELARLRKAPHGFRAVHVLSSMVSSRRKFGKELEAANQVILSVIITGAYHKVFHLSSGDIVFIYSQVTTSAIVALCTALETGLFVGVKPHKNVYGDFGNYKIFDLGKDLARLVEGVRTSLSHEREVVSVKNPISIKHMEYITSQIRTSNIRSIVFNQPIYNISHAKPSIEFLEFYTSIHKLEQLFVPDHSISANPWLFNMVKRELDVAVMRAISSDIPSYRHKAFSLNLVVESFLSDGFREFIGSLPSKLAGRIYIELDKADLVQNSDFFADILERAEAMRVPLCIDGISHHDTQLLQLSRVKCDFLKLKWTPEILNLPDAVQADLIDDLKAAAAKVVLTRCDTANSLSFARSAGIQFIQGHLADEFFRSGEIL